MVTSHARKKKPSGVEITNSDNAYWRFAGYENNWQGLPNCQIEKAKKEKFGCSLFPSFFVQDISVIYYLFSLSLSVSLFAPPKSPVAADVCQNISQTKH